MYNWMDIELTLKLTEYKFKINKIYEFFNIVR